MVPELLAPPLGKALDRSLLDGPIHALQLPVPTGVVHLGAAKLDVAVTADATKT